MTIPIRPQQSHLSWPWTASQVEDLDAMLQTLFKRLTALSRATTDLTEGSVVFAGPNNLLDQDNSRFFWDDANHRLGIGTFTPSTTLEVSGTTTVKLPHGTSATYGLQIIRSEASGVYGGAERAIWVPGPDGNEGYGFTVNEQGAIFTGAWVIISGKIVSNYPQDASDAAGLSPHEPTMLSLVTDIVGPAIQTLPYQVGSWHFSALERTTGHHIFNIEADGSLTWGAGVRGAEDTNLYRVGVGQLQTDGVVAGPLGIHVKNSSIAGGNTHASLFVENSSSYGQLFKAGTGYVGYKNIVANDLGYYNTGGNISILNDSGNVNIAPNGASTATLTLTNTLTTIATRFKGYPDSNSITAFQWFKADASTIVLNVDTTNVRLGIGTAAPTQKLTVAGSIDIGGGGNSFVYGTSNADTRITGDNGGGASSYLKLITLGTQRLLIDEGGDISIGTLVGANVLYWDNTNARLGVGTASPSQKITVAGAINVTSGNSFVFGTSTTNTRITGDDSGGANSYLQFLVNGNRSLTLDVNNRVGVGTGALSPAAILHLTAGTASASTAPLKFIAGTNLTSAEAGAMEWDGTNLFISQTTGPTRKTLKYTTDFPYIAASTFEKAETGTDANVLTYTTNASTDEALHIGVMTDVSALTGTSVVVTVTWKDSNNATATATTTLSGVSDGTINVPINAFKNTNVVISTVFTGVSTAYNISAVITRNK